MYNYYFFANKIRTRKLLSSITHKWTNSNMNSSYISNNRRSCSGHFISCKLAEKGLLASAYNVDVRLVQEDADAELQLSKQFLGALVLLALQMPWFVLYSNLVSAAAAVHLFMRTDTCMHTYTHFRVNTNITQPHTCSHIRTLRCSDAIYAFVLFAF